MVSHAKVIMVMLITLAVAGWLSPCCCQTAWVATSVSQVMASTDDEASGCGCCESNNEEQSRDCCPEGDDLCAPSVAKMTPGEAATVKPVAASGWIWIDQTAVASRACISSREASSGVNRPPGLAAATLLGLRCALVI